MYSPQLTHSSRVATSKESDILYVYIFSIIIILVTKLLFNLIKTIANGVAVYISHLRRERERGKAIANKYEYITPCSLPFICK